MNNVFILTPGRTASTTFSKACEHFDNFTAGHETRTEEIGESRLNYPDNHIEVDNRLVWFLGALEKKYGDDAYYIYLRRNNEDVAKSYLQRWGSAVSVVNGFGHAILKKSKINKNEREKICKFYVDTVEQNVMSFLSGKTKTMIIDIDEITHGFDQFMSLIGAKGDYNLSIKELSTYYNRNKNKTAGRSIKVFLIKIKKMLQEFPSWFDSL